MGRRACPNPPCGRAARTFTTHLPALGSGGGLSGLGPSYLGPGSSYSMGGNNQKKKADPTPAPPPPPEGGGFSRE